MPTRRARSAPSPICRRRRSGCGSGGGGWRFQAPGAGNCFGVERTAMSKVRSAFLAAATERGFVPQCTDLAALDARLAGGAVTAYVGYDCTADSLHIGHLMSIMLLRLFQQHGNKPIVLMGGGTTRIGDPTGRDETRQLLSHAEIARTIAGIAK